MNISKSNLKNAIANYSLAIRTIANESLNAQKNIQALATIIETNEDILKTETDKAKILKLNDEINTFTLKISAEKDKLEKCRIEENKRTADFTKAISPLYSDYVELMSNKDSKKYKTAVESWLKDYGITFTAEDIFTIVSAVGLRKTSNKKLFETGEFTAVNSEKAFRDLICRTICDLTADQLPKFKWTYKPAKKIK